MKTKQEWKIGNCLELLPTIEDKSIDMILTDLPYGTTACKWDTIIPFEPLWEQYRRVIKDNGAIVLTASQPFTSALVMSNPKMFKYSWVWNKNRATGHVHAKNKPMKQHEDICIFSKGNTLHKTQSLNRMVYNPQGLTELPLNTKRRTRNDSGDSAVMSERKSHHETITTHTGYPTSIVNFDIVMQCNDRIHPTQKPVALFEYLIKTYTNEGDIVHDSCLGSGTTLEACLNTNRNCIGGEISDEWVPHYKKRLMSDNSKLTDSWIK